MVHLRLGDYFRRPDEALDAFFLLSSHPPCLRYLWGLNHHLVVLLAADHLEVLYLSDYGFSIDHQRIQTSIQMPKIKEEKEFLKLRMSNFLLSNG
jgi:hypothetical protein